mmetsp:Transcript_81641/g.264501  ORF Transcript_81641/g.264501 Transcript_81641/m.264501 type:complete len:238 (+) Transcript_81641:81-794(+)
MWPNWMWRCHARSRLARAFGAAPAPALPMGSRAPLRPLGVQAASCPKPSQDSRERLARKPPARGMWRAASVRAPRRPLQGPPAQHESAFQPPRVATSPAVARAAPPGWSAGPRAGHRRSPRTVAPQQRPRGHLAPPAQPPRPMHAALRRDPRPPAPATRTPPRAACRRSEPPAPRRPWRSAAHGCACTLSPQQGVAAPPGVRTSHHAQQRHTSAATPPRAPTTSPRRPPGNWPPRLC